MLDSYFRLCKIAEVNQLLEAGLEGRKRLQKIAFLSKALGYPIGTSFVFHLHGPYSPGLAAQLSEVRDLGLLIGSSVEPYRLSQQGIEFVTNYLSEHPEEKPPLEILQKISKEVGGRPTASLELLATVFYLGGVGYDTRPEIMRKVEELKPRRFSPEEVEAAVELKGMLLGEK